MSRLDHDALFYDKLIRFEIDYLWGRLQERNWNTVRRFASSAGVPPGTDGADEAFKRNVVIVLVQDDEEAEFSEPCLRRLWRDCASLCASNVEAPVAHEQPYSFSLEDGEAWTTHLADHGYVVLRGVADPSEVEAATCLLWDDIEELYGISRGDSDAWGAWAVDERGLMAGLTQSAGAWAIRGLPKLKQAYARIWGEDDLLVSMDVVLLWKPWRVVKTGRPVTEGFHLDQNPFSKPHRVCVQGMVPLISVTEETGGLHVVPDSHLEAAKTEWKRRYPKYDMYVVSGAIGDFEKCNGLYQYDGLLNGKMAYTNVSRSIIYFDGQWKMSLGPQDCRTLKDTEVWCFSVDSGEDEPPAGAWEALDASHACQVQKGKAGGDWCPCNDPGDPSPQIAKLLHAEPGDLILWDARTVHGGEIGSGVLPPPPGTPAKLSRLSVAVNMTPRAWASEMALQSRRDALRDGINLTMYPHEVGAADGTVRDVLLAGGGSEPVRWAKRAVLNAAQAALVPLDGD